MAAGHADGISRGRRKKQGECGDAKSACAAGVLQELCHQPHAQPGVPSSRGSTMIWASSPAGGAVHMIQGQSWDPNMFSWHRLLLATVYFWH